ncbi:MAG: NAD(P)-dependent oxidoreductase [Candidatus Uhrbacteria bacterium]
MNKFKRVAVLDTVIFYPEHRQLLNQFAEEVLEFPSSLPDGLEKQLEDKPELFLNKKCYTHIAADNTPLQLLMNRVEGADVIISCWTGIPDEILRLNPQLKLIIFWTHEKEHRINTKLAEELGISVTNIPDYGTDAVAEVVFAGLWQLLIKNNRLPRQPESGTEVMNAIMHDLFIRYRKLPNNEKYTRAGKFSHHFHKLGLVNFDFTQKSLDELIPERLIEHKHIGLLNITQSKETISALHSFGVIANAITIADFSLATAYKFCAEHEYIYFDSHNAPTTEIEKMRILFPGKFIDIRTLTSTNRSFQNNVFGIVGLGRIGTRVARIAKSLGFEVIYFSKNRKPEIEYELGVRYVALDELAKMSDVISIHVPAHKAEGLISRPFIESMRNNTLFINTADGNALDRQALTERMETGEINTYLDVYPGLPRKDILGLPMKDKTDWKLHDTLANNVFAYRAGWKTQESIRIKTHKLLGEMTNFLITNP